jgi:hypothetical protein
MSSPHVHHVNPVEKENWEGWRAADPNKRNGRDALPGRPRTARRSVPTSGSRGSLHLVLLASLRFAEQFTNPRAGGRLFDRLTL